MRVFTRILGALCCVLLFGASNANICVNEPDGARLPDPTSRQRYIWCQNGRQNVGQCRQGEEFDPFDRVCDVSRWIPPQTTRSVTRDVCANQPNGTFLPDSSSRWNFIHCSNGRSTVGTCPDGLFFNPAGGYCDTDIQTTTRATRNQPPVPSATRGNNRTTLRTTARTTRTTARNVTTRRPIPTRVG